MHTIEHATPELFAALAAAQGEVENAAKNSNNPHFKSKYADLAEVLNTIRPVFAKHGLSLIQSPAFDGSLAHVTTVLAHSGGGYITTTASCMPAKSDAQGIGSATTYLRRYSAAAVAGIAQEDDDGNAAAHNNKPRAVQADYSKWINAAESVGDEAGYTKLREDVIATFGDPKRVPKPIASALSAAKSRLPEAA